MDDILKSNNPNVSPHNITPDSNSSCPVPEDLDMQWLRWKCLVCGYVYEGAVELRVCPKCSNEDPDKFDDAE